MGDGMSDVGFSLQPRDVIEWLELVTMPNPKASYQDRRVGEVLEVVGGAIKICGGSWILASAVVRKHGSVASSKSQFFEGCLAIADLAATVVDRDAPGLLIGKVKVPHGTGVRYVLGIFSEEVASARGLIAEGDLT